METARRLVIASAATVVALASVTAVAQETEPLPVPDLSTSDAAIGSEAERPVEPWIHPSMPDCVKEKILAAFDIAIERVREVPECADLFTELGVNGEEMLEKALYFPAGPYRETTKCRRSFAVTEVGGSTIWVCRTVSSHSDEHVAVALVHEALHHAGLTEYPHDRNGLCSDAINGLIMRSCGF